MANEAARELHNYLLNLGAKDGHSDAYSHLLDDALANERRIGEQEYREVVVALIRAWDDPRSGKNRYDRVMGPLISLARILVADDAPVRASLGLGDGAKDRGPVEPGSPSRYSGSGVDGG